ncbi:very short patch repair endonuclease [Saccharothrix longispora]|uniref:DNA mismatch endonuclease (Patch repair protein) n=1 Tax=Saccharothrix longispora TaxID=33920 RepID=A0ABU1PYT8_9PSEU|nr:very short patch repair endonuclease [Saccharothrix longispora]MDR6595801.1 DNA mismatch endonuclease (patch repair protein) [Saccharothrix longispora]
MDLDAGQTTEGSVVLKASEETGVIRAYLRWRDRGRTVSRSLGVVEHRTRSANLVEGWERARSLGLAREEALPDDSWASSRDVRASMRGNRGRDTSPELRLRAALHARGLRYRVSTRPLPELRRTADIVFPKERLAVFVDGCFWHGCPEHHRPAKKNSGFWSTKIVDNKRRDAETNQALIEQGWTVIRCWEHEDVDTVMDQIVSSLGRSAHQR